VREASYAMSSHGVLLQFRLVTKKEVYDKKGGGGGKPVLIRSKTEEKGWRLFVKSEERGEIFLKGTSIGEEGRYRKEQKKEGEMVDQQPKKGSTGGIRDQRGRRG